VSDKLDYIVDLDSQADITSVEQSFGVQLRWPAVS
jgi:hypothetical protein